MAARWGSADQAEGEEHEQSFGDSVHEEEIARTAGAAMVGDEASASKHGVSKLSSGEWDSARSVVNTPYGILQEDLT